MQRHSWIVTFDLGNVVVRLSGSTRESAKRAGIPWRPATHAERPEQASHLLERWQLGQIDDDRLFEAWADALGGRFSAAEAEIISQAWLLGEFEGIHDIIQRLDQRHVRLGCLSNTCNHHWQWMLNHPDRFPSFALLHEKHASHLMGVMKPDPSIYARFEQAVGHQASNIVFFDDILGNVAAAKAQGWHAFLISPQCPPSEQ
ncbi:MAG TPA: HAD-IA family hydrolase, partial [Polyangiaceae bacterium]|nr:HAD-IA family hydrolase [Polyangiaceae bacterium]